MTDLTQTDVPVGATVAGMARLRYEDPPPPKRQNLIYQLSMMTLEPQDRWGSWVRIGTYAGRVSAKTTCQHLRDQHQRRLPPGRWEFRYGELPDGEEGYGVWARYLGTAD